MILFYNDLKEHAFIALSKRGTKIKKLTLKGNVICNNDLAMYKDRKYYIK